MEAPYTDKSVTLDGSSQTIFPSETPGNDRFIHNQPGNDTLWINIFGDPAAVNGDGCIGLVAGALMDFDSNIKVNVLGTAGQKIAAGER